MVPLRYNLRSVVVRRTTSAMTAVGVALVVMIVFILLGFVAGLRSTMLSSGSSGAWIVLSRAVTSESSSYVTREQYEIIRARGEIDRDASGAPLISPEIVASFNPAPDGPLSQSSFTFLRGVYPVAYKVHSGIRVESGRLPEPGQPELIVGRRLAARFPDLAPARQLQFSRTSWTIVGTFSDGGSEREAEVWTDLDVLQQQLHFGSGFASLHIGLRPGAGESFQAALTRDARLRLDAMPERRFYRLQSSLADELRNLGMVVAVMLGIGAVFGGMNTMYSAVSRRGKEVGVLRALGYSRIAILMSFILESVIIALVGGLVGEVLGLIVAAGTGLSSHMMAVATYIFSFRLAPSAFFSGLGAAVAIGAIGGLLPAWRAARMNVIDSLRMS